MFELFYLHSSLITIISKVARMGEEAPGPQDACSSFWTLLPLDSPGMCTWLPTSHDLPSLAHGAGTSLTPAALASPESSTLLSRVFSRSPCPQYSQIRGNR